MAISTIPTQRCFLLLALALLISCKPATPPTKCPRQAAARPAQPGVVRVAYAARGLRLVVEVLDDDLLHFEMGKGGKLPGAIAVTPMVHKRDYHGPRWLRRQGHTLITPELKLTVDPATLALTVRTGRGKVLTTARPLRRGKPARLVGLSFSKEQTSHAYGLGQQFGPPGQTDGDWLGRVRAPGNRFGNKMVSYEGGAVGNTQIPVLYALGAGLHGYGLFVDRPEAQRWDLRKDPWEVTLEARSMRWYLLAGHDLADLRRDYMELTGRPPVPPKQALGLWISEYGYRGWDHAEQKLVSLRAAGFPVDGVVLDLFWFGGITGGSPQSRMGSLTWDLSHFTDPAARIARWRSQGTGVVLIEESYVSKALPEYAVLAASGYLVRRQNTARPLHLDSWWGAGGMLDWTSPAAGDFWHDYRRAALVRAGVMGHWTDLGEPEDFDEAGHYHGLPPRHQPHHAAVANLYNLAWAASIQRGYRRQRARRRPWVLSRSGTAGIQRHGVAMWSGDIGSNTRSLRAHFWAQMQLSLSGVDYFGSDIGGFHRKALGQGPGKEKIHELYTQWLACGAAVDVPVRPHTMNLSRSFETTPDRVGHSPSNLANIRLRLRLGPYLYALAHLAQRSGEAIFPPLVYHFQRDLTARRLGRQKMIGRWLMVTLEARQGATDTDVYLPAGEWFDYHSGARLQSKGRWLRKQPLRHQGKLRLPLHARAGALIPEQLVDAGTLNITGLRSGGTRPRTLRVRVFPGAAATEFWLFEDDGQTVAYLDGALRRTRISQQQSGERVTVVIEPAVGTYDGAPSSRAREVLLVVPRTVRRVTLDGERLEAGTISGPGWKVEGSVVRAWSAELPVDQRTEFVFWMGHKQ